MNYESLNQFLTKTDLSLTGVMGVVSPPFEMFKIRTSTYHTIKIVVDSYDHTKLKIYR